MAEGGREAIEPGDQDLTAVGRIRKPVGLKGWVAVTVFGHTLERLACPCPVLVGRNPRSTKAMVLTGMHRDPKGYRCRFGACEDRDCAERLREQTVFLHTRRLPRLEEDEFYHFELEGMEAVAAEDGSVIGAVIAVHNYPTTDAIEVRLRSGGTVLVPMVGDAIAEIDRANRRMVLRTALLGELM